MQIDRPGLIVADRWQDYQLLDCGDGMKEEKWSAYTLVRPDPQIIWPRRTSSPWRDWDGFYHRNESGGGKWEFRGKLPEQWTITYGALKFRIHPTSFKHTGLFPEQAVNWDWFSQKIKSARAADREVSVLNLFGYTGAATVAAAHAGASVCHVDAAKGMVKWCRENAALSGLGAASIRYIVDDCLKFVRREIKRGRRYDAVIMDPPTYGHGTGETWKLEDHLWKLLRETKEVLSDRLLFFLINVYTARLSASVVLNLLDSLLHESGGRIRGGELGLPIRNDGKILPCGIYGRWEPV